jgi:hypothetical protein
MLSQRMLYRNFRKIPEEAKLKCNFRLLMDPEFMIKVNIKFFLKIPVHRNKKLVPRMLSHCENVYDL